MDWWALAVTGLAATAALLGAAWSDQRRRRRRQAVLREVPERTIPGLERDLKPNYVLPDDPAADPATDRPATPEPQRPPADGHDRADDDGVGEAASPTPEPPRDQATTRPADDHDRAERTRLDPASAVAGGWADDRFVTDRARGWAVLDHPLVLVAERITAFRQLWPALARCRRAQTGLVVVAADLDPATVDALAVNVVQGRLAAVAVRGLDPAARAAVARATGAKPMRLADLLSGYLPDTGLGGCATWVANAAHSWALPVDGSRAAPDEPPPG
jgi:hypothetical protein